jgi:hypothetical protein
VDLLKIMEELEPLVLEQLEVMEIMEVILVGQAVVVMDPLSVLQQVALVLPELCE